MLAMGGSRSTIPRSSGCCCETRNSPTHCLPDTCSSRDGPLRLDDLAAEPLVVYPKSPRPSYADQVLSLLEVTRFAAEKHFESAAFAQQCQVIAILCARECICPT